MTAHKKKASPMRAPQQVRIIGGQWKRTPLTVLDAEGLRPTPDRVRETVFNWLNHLLDGTWESTTCLDLFAGTGALGLEAASRGARRVVLIESNVQAVKQLEATRTKLNAAQVEIVRGDALVMGEKLVRTEAGKFQLVFLDPPYHKDWLSRVLPLCDRLLAADGLMYVEAEMPLEEMLPELISSWEELRADKAGMVFYYLLRRKNTSGFEA